MALVVDVGRPRIGDPLDFGFVVRRNLLGQLGARDPRVLRDVRVG